MRVIAPVAPSTTSSRPLIAVLALLALSFARRFQVIDPLIVTSASSGGEYQTYGTAPTSTPRVAPATVLVATATTLTPWVVLSSFGVQPMAVPRRLASLLPVPKSDAASWKRKLYSWHHRYTCGMPASKPVGSRRHNHHGYIQVKTEIGRRRWPFEHRVVWEATHGPLPAGAEVHHINGIRDDNRIENLELTTSHSAHFRNHDLVAMGRKGGLANKGKTIPPDIRARMSAARLAYLRDKRG